MGLWLAGNRKTRNWGNFHYIRYSENSLICIVQKEIRQDLYETITYTSKNISENKLNELMALTRKIRLL